MHDLLGSLPSYMRNVCGTEEPKWIWSRSLLNLWKLFSLVFVDEALLSPLFMLSYTLCKQSAEFSGPLIAVHEKESWLMSVLSCP